MIVTLDEYSDNPEDAKIKKDLYVKAIERHGSPNVRYCKVIPSQVQTVVTIEGLE